MDETSRAGLPPAEAARTPERLGKTRDAGRERAVHRRLGARSVVLVGLMGAGKSTIGRRLAVKLDLPFRDADHEIEAAAGMSVPDIFQNYGEAFFRDGERRVIARLLHDGPMVLATGGGAFMSAETRARIAASAVSIWLRADFAVLMRRVRKRSNRPLLQNQDPEATMRRLMEIRYPIYAQADLTVESWEAPQERVVAEALEALHRWLDTPQDTPATGLPGQSHELPEGPLGESRP